MPREQRPGDGGRYDVVIVGDEVVTGQATSASRVNDGFESETDTAHRVRARRQKLSPPGSTSPRL